MTTGWTAAEENAEYVAIFDPVLLTLQVAWSKKLAKSPAIPRKNQKFLFGD